MRKTTLLILLIITTLSACAPQTAAPMPTALPMFTPLPSLPATLPPTPVLQPTETRLPTATSTATATKPATATATPEAPILQNFQMAKTWQEMQANFNGYRAPWESMTNGSLAETIRQQIVSKMIKDGTLKVPTDADKMYPLDVGWDVSGYRSIVTTSLEGSPAYRPKAIGWMRLMCTPEINAILVRNGVNMPTDPNKQFFQIMVVVYWGKIPDANGKNLYEPRILFYNSDPETIAYQKDMNSNIGIFPFIKIPSGGSMDGLPITPPLSEAESWAKQGYPSKVFEKLLLRLSSPFTWP